MKVKNLFTGRKRFVAIGVTTALVLGIAGGAFAYFTNANGSGSGNATVGNSSPWGVSVVAASAIPPLLYPDDGSSLPGAPGTHTDYYHLIVTNNGKGYQELNQVALTVTIDTPHVTAGCLASWFSVDGTTPTGTDTITAGVDLAPGGTWSPSLTNEPASEDVSVELIDTPSTDQSSCEGASVTLTAAAS